MNKIERILLTLMVVLMPGKVQCAVAAHDAWRVRTTHCLGRYVLDLPEGARLQAKFLFADADVRTHRSVDGAEYLRRLADRERDLRSADHVLEEHLFVDREDFDAHHVSLTSWDGPQSRRVHRYDLYAYVPERAVLFDLTGRGNATPRARTMASEYQRDLLMKSLRYRPNVEIPREPGFCVDSGFIARSVVNSERVIAEVVVPQYPGVAITFVSSVTGTPDLELLERTPPVPREYQDVVSRMTTIRRGTREAGGASGQELLVRADSGDKRTYDFLWESQGEANSLAKPFLSLRMRTTERTDDQDESIDAPFSSDEAAIAFWDRMLAGLRPRPGAVER